MTDVLVQKQPLIEQEEENNTCFDDSASLFEQEFTEQDVLPFLLQAQDIISKLESRVVELETDLSVNIFCSLVNNYFYS